MATFYVQSPNTGTIYEVSAVDRSNMTARGYVDVTDRDGAKRHAEQNSAHAGGDQSRGGDRPAIRKVGPNGSPGPASQNTDDAAKA